MTWLKYEDWCKLWGVPAVEPSSLAFAAEQQNEQALWAALQQPPPPEYFGVDRVGADKKDPEDAATGLKKCAQHGRFYFYECGHCARGTTPKEEPVCDAKDRNARGGKFEWTNPGEPQNAEALAAIALTELLRWLARPTLAERFDAFQVRIAATVCRAEAHGVRYVFDCDSRRGPHVVILHQDGDETLLLESETDEDIQGTFEAEVFDVGREALKP